MKWQGRRQSSNVEDRRGQSARRIRGGAIGGGGLIILLVIALLTGDPGILLQGLGDSVSIQSSDANYVETPQDRERADFISVVLADTEDIWSEIFKENNLGPYREPRLVLYTGTVDSACGTGQAAMGPFYCSGDEQIYLDLSFFDEMANNFNAPGDFAMAYVLAHEVGHHVQTLLGVTEQLHNLNGRISQREYNKYSVRFELQADYLAGVWANRVKNKGYLEVGDLQEAIMAAQGVGDDRIQKEAYGRVMPDSFTHGTSDQRMRWFNMGYQTGDLSNWDTFSLPEDQL